MANKIVSVDVKIKRNKKGEIPKKILNFIDRYVKLGIYGRNASKPSTRGSGLKGMKLGKVALRNELGVNTYEIKKTIKFKNPRTQEWVIFPKGSKITIPARPAFRTFTTNKIALKRIGTTAASAIRLMIGKRGISFRQAWKYIGDVALINLKNIYKSKMFEPNSDKTTAIIKGFDYPLMDDSEVYNAISYSILSGNKESDKEAKKLERTANKKNAEYTTREVKISEHTRNGKIIKEHTRMVRTRVK